MPSTDRKLELKAKTSVAQTGSQLFVYAKGLTEDSFNVLRILHLFLPVKHAWWLSGLA
jgi:hypothetical protein